MNRINRYLIIFIGVACVVTITSYFSYANLDFKFDIVSMKPRRPHLVQAGKTTTFVLNLENTSDSFQTITVYRSSYWIVLLQEADDMTFAPVGAANESLIFKLNPQEKRNILVKISAPGSEAIGKQMDTFVRATSGSGVNKTVCLKAQVYNKPKIYLVGIDALGKDYLFVGKDGQKISNPSGVDYKDIDKIFLMPNVEKFLLSNNTAYSKTAHSLLPSATDMNHTAVLTGSWPGTSGIFYVASYYAGLNYKWVLDPSQPKEQRLTKKWVEEYVSPNHKFLKYGSDGKKDVVSIFDMARANGPKDNNGDSIVFNTFISGKVWLNNLYDDKKGTIDLIVSTYTPSPKSLNPVPYYLNQIEKYNFSYPPSSEHDPKHIGQDPDANGIPHTVIDKDATPFGDNPWLFPSDRWVIESALKIITAEDPDVIHIILAGVDDVEHAYGAADKPDEWSEGSPDILWDDFNKYNPRANRQVTIDIVHEADYCFGMIINALKGRKIFDDSVLVLYADHGQLTFMQDPKDSDPNTEGVEINLKRVICGNNSTEFDKCIESWYSAGPTAGLFITDKGHDYINYIVPRILSSFECLDPITGKKARPLVVISRQEMETGIDDGIGRFAAGTSGSVEKRAELYNQWYVKYSDFYSCKNGGTYYPISVGKNPNNIRWPDLLVFIKPEYRFQFRLMNSKNLGASQSSKMSSFIGAHGGFGTQDVPLAMHGPKFKNINFSNWQKSLPRDSEYVSLVDIAPTLYKTMGWAIPENVDGKALDKALK